MTESESLPRRPPRRRKRKLVSCRPCHIRKVKCDQGRPACGRCCKLKQTHACVYEQANDSSHAAAGSSEAVQGPAQSFQSIPGPASTNHPPNQESSRNQGTWQLLGVQSTTTGLTMETQRPVISTEMDLVGLSSAAIRGEEQKQVIFRGENFRTHYYGGSNATSLIGQFPELRRFMKEAIMQHTALPRVQRDLKALQVEWKKEKGACLPAEHSGLWHLLPPREIARQLIRRYCDTFESTYRILHRPSFLADYEACWDDPAAARPALVVMMLLVMSCVIGVPAAPETESDVTVMYVGDSSVARERAVLWIEVAERWLQVQSQKMVYLAIWQIRCLLILAKQINVFKKKRFWTETGTLLREAMAAGLHRDPGLLGEKVSFFDQEMRRRLWATITELELQASIDRGMPSASAGIFADCRRVLNIDDEALSVAGSSGSNQQINGQEDNQYTDTSFLWASRASFALRVSLNSFVNDLGSPDTYDQVSQYEEQITQQLRMLPSWVLAGTGEEEERERERNRDPREAVPSSRRPPSSLAASLLRLQLHQFFLILHAPFTRKTDVSPRSSLSRMICFQASRDILKQYRRVDQSVYFPLLLLRLDFFRAALVTSYTAYASLRSDDLFSQSTNVFLQHVDDVLTMLEHRITRLGTGFTHYWYISAASGFLRSVISPADSATQKTQAVERVTSQYFRVLASQEDMARAREEINLHITDMNITPDLSFHPLTEGVFDTDLPFPEFFFGDPAAWTFENFE